MQQVRGIFVVGLLALIPLITFAGGRVEQDLSGSGWRLWRDEQAQWKDDELFLPGAELAGIPVNPPTGGWGILSDTTGMVVNTPGTVEQYLGNGEVVNDDFFNNNKKPTQDLTGVSWWWRTVQVPTSATGRHVMLRFEAVRERAEVYLDGKLVGYDLVGSTPFEVDVTGLAKPGQTCRLAVRVTNPGGDFSWGDVDQQPWGKYKLPYSRNFSGITGPVKLVVCDPVYIDDLYVQNTPAMRDVNLEVTFRNQTKTAAHRNVLVTIAEKNAAGAELFSEEVKDVDIPVGESKRTIKVSAPNAKLWDLDHPNLYTCTVSLSSPTINNQQLITDADSRVMGFRWFAPEGFGTNALFRLNGKKIVLRSAISWGYWPVSGIVPSPEQAERQIRVAKQFGLNMLNFHRCMGQSWVLDKADELGLLYYAEPGGYTSGGTDPFAQAICLEKLKRMVKHFRSHPSMAIYNMINEQWSVYGADKDETLFAKHKADMKAAHELDPSRVIGYTSSTTIGEGHPAKMKLHMRPFDMQHYMVGWADAHESIGPVVWPEKSYQSPTFHRLRSGFKTEIAIRGEEGAISSPPRVELIKAEIDKAPHKGWDGVTYLKWYDDFARFLERKHLKPYFPTVDALCTSMGAIALEEQGRFIECFRISNNNDLYCINGWEAQISDDHSGVVDCYRYPKADPAILAYYNQPLYVAVMSRNAVLTNGADATVDFFIVNEKDLRGAYILRAIVRDAAGKETMRKEIPVRISGGDVSGELLAEAVKLPVTGTPGMCRIEAQILGADGKELARGYRQVLSVDWKSNKRSGRGAVYAWDGAVNRFLKEQAGVEASAFDDTQGKLDWLLVTRPTHALPELIPPSAFQAKDGQPGLTATFEISGKPVGQRIDKQLRFDCPYGASADPSVPPMAPFTVKWEGTLIPPASGVYNFVIRANRPQNVSVWINGKNVFAGKVSWWTRGDVSGSLELHAGKPVSVLVQFKSEGNGSGKCELLWSVPGRNGVAPERLLDRVKDQGTTLIVADFADTWMPLIAAATGVKYDGTLAFSGDGWMSGQYFVRQHPLFKELPVNCGLDWPYEKLVQEGRCRYLLKLEGEELVAGGYHTFRPRGFGTAVGVIPYGKGKIIVSTLDVISNLDSTEGPAEVARKLLCNYIEYGNGLKQP